MQKMCTLTLEIAFTSLRYHLLHTTDLASVFSDTARLHDRVVDARAALACDLSFSYGTLDFRVMTSQSPTLRKREACFPESSSWHDSNAQQLVVLQKTHDASSWTRVVLDFQLHPSFYLLYRLLDGAFDGKIDQETWLIVWVEYRMVTTCY